MSDKLEWGLAAWDNIEKYLADAVDENGPDSIQENMYILAFDGAVDAGADHETARDIAIMHAGDPNEFC